MYSSGVLAPVGCLVLGGLTLVNWGFAMFSDHWYADMVRYQSKTWFNLGRNTESVITPAAGLSFIFLVSACCYIQSMPMRVLWAGF